MTIDDVMQWLKSLGKPTGGASWTMARMDVSKTKRIGVYQRPQRNGMERSVGNAPTTKCKHVQLLVHWTQNAHDTELAAQELYDAIAAAVHPTIGATVVDNVSTGGVQADYIDLLMPEPADLGAEPGSGIFERAIWLDIYHQ